MTTTQLSLQHPNEIIDEYVRQSFHTIFLRPISPYGFAIKSSHRTGYQMDAFLDFYRTGLRHILEINKKGYNLVEIYTKILLQKILTPDGTGYVDLQSPSGAGLNVLVYNYDGDVYATDESRMLAEMGDHTFRLGNVLTQAVPRQVGWLLPEDQLARVVQAVPRRQDAGGQGPPRTVAGCGGDRGQGT
jgi:hypothetical protein